MSITQATFLQDDEVAIFPSSKRNIQQSRLTTENRYASFIRNALDVDGFVMDYDGYAIEFYICGIYFKCDITNLLSNVGSGETLFATAKIITTNDSVLDPMESGLYNYLDFQDTTSDCTLLSFSTIKPNMSFRRGVYKDSVNSTYTLPLGDKPFSDVDRFRAFLDYHTLQQKIGVATYVENISTKYAEAPIPTWISSTRIRTPQFGLVYCDGILYVNKTGLIRFNQNSPDVDTDNWVVANTRGEWSSSVEYDAFDVVFYSDTNKYYVSKQNGNINHTPCDYSSYAYWYDPSTRVTPYTKNVVIDCGVISTN